VRVVFALDCCDREAMSLLATPAGIDVRVLMVAAIEHRFGMAHRLPVTIEWLSDNGSCYVARTPAASHAISVSNRERHRSKVHRATGMAEAFVRTISTRFTRTRLSDIIHPVSSSQLAEVPDRVRSFAGWALLSSGPIWCCWAESVP
jgi:putative transposase